MKFNFVPVADLIESATAFAQDQSPGNQQLLAAALRGIHNAGQEQEAYRAEVETARARYANDDLEIDDEAIVSVAEKGIWVNAWVWVPEEDAGE